MVDVLTKESDDSASHQPQPDAGISNSVGNKSERKLQMKVKIAEFILDLYKEQSVESNGLFPKKTVRSKFAEFVTSKKYKTYFARSDIGTLLRQFKFLNDTPRGSNYFSIPIQNVLEFYKKYFELETVEHSKNLSTSKVNDERIESCSTKPSNLNTKNKPGRTKPKPAIKNIAKSEIAKFISKLHKDLSLGQDGNVSKITVRREFSKFLKTNNFDENDIVMDIGTLLRDYKFLKDTPRGSNNYCIPIQKVYEFEKENSEKLNGLETTEDSKNCNNLDNIDTEIAESLETLSIHETEKAKTLLVGEKTQIAKTEIAKFVLKLYHELHLQQDGNVSKATVRSQFSEFLKANNYDENSITKDIGTILREAGCLYNTPRGSPDYRISLRKIFEFRNETLKQLDDIRINGSLKNQKPKTVDNDIPLEAEIEVCADAEEFPLVYQGGCKQNVDASFKLSNLGCYICQQNFKTQLLYEDHVSTHSFESDFEFLSNLDWMDNIFEINYRLCKKSHFFNFTMKTKNKDVVIEKIIVIQTRLMEFVKNELVPFDIASDGMESFLIDSHLFTIGVEQPVVVVYSNKFDKTTRFMEQHHFLRIEEFPQVNFKIRSGRLSSKCVMKTKFWLEDYFPDAELKASQRCKFSDESLMNVSENFRTYLSDKTLHQRNVYDVFRTELQIEELETENNYYPLRQRAAQIKRFGREYSVKLKQLPKHICLENIVSPLDEICLTVAEKSMKPKNPNIKIRRNRQDNHFTAIIERVYHDTVCFKYDKEVIDQYVLYDIILRPSRLLLKYQYRALEMLSFSNDMKNFLFPTEVSNTNKCVAVKKLEFFNSSIESNTEQLQAVLNITLGDFSVPYIIFGPPGTGKTTTIVETILQLWKQHPDTRILITAGSNAACDEVAIRLCRVISQLETQALDILRIFAKSNEKRLDSIDDILIEASNFYAAHFYPSIESIKMYRIIVCTHSVVGKLVSADMGTKFFTHIFIDECAASTEPEALVALMGITSSKTKLILSGDHKQLGSVLKSRRAADLGLKVSLMERLLNRKCYETNENGDYDRSIQTRLVQNYRSHPEIVRLFNCLYYNNQLKPLANMGQFDWATQWHMLPNRNYPIIFHTVYGNSRKINSSVSLSNEQEVSAVMDYVKDLLYFGMKDRKIDESDIGIISPYKKQYTRIKEELGRRRWYRIEVGAVETFQGKEKPIIIVSTVRSFTNSLGFLDSPNRLNVILSRAIALLIFIGNPITLSQSGDFKFIIDECHRNNCLVGGAKTFIEDKAVGNVNNFAKIPVQSNKKKSNKSSITRTSLKSKNNQDSNPTTVYKLCFKDFQPSQLANTSSNDVQLPTKKPDVKLENVDSRNGKDQHFEPILKTNNIMSQKLKPQAAVVPRTQCRTEFKFDNDRTHLPISVQMPLREQMRQFEDDYVDGYKPSRYDYDGCIIAPYEDKKPKTKGCVIG